MATSEREKDFVIIAPGMVYMSVCSSLSPKETVRRANQEQPTGVHPWAICDDKTFVSGEPNPSPCDEYPETHKHYLLNC